jgi:hypothetical protein
MIYLHEGRGAGAGRGCRPRTYSLRVTLAGIQPRVWRRLLVRETMRLSRLHEAVQVLFGWCDYQTHAFAIGGRRYGNPLNRGGVVIGDDRAATLADVRLADHGRAVYDYLFAEGWRVDIRVEKILGTGEVAPCPRCVAGERAGAPEDCGGIEAYKDMLYCLKHPATDLGREWRAWLGPGYDPEACDLAAINRALKRLAK